MQGVDAWNPLLSMAATTRGPLNIQPMNTQCSVIKICGESSAKQQEKNAPIVFEGFRSQSAPDVLGPMGAGFPCLIA